MKKIMHFFLAAIGAMVLGGGAVSAQSYMADPRQFADAYENMFQQMAGILEISAEDAKNAWAEGKTMQQIAREHDISMEELQQRMKDYRVQEMKNELQVLVDQGVISQDQANQRLQAVGSAVREWKEPLL